VVVSSSGAVVVDKGEAVQPKMIAKAVKKQKKVKKWGSTGSV